MKAEVQMQIHSENENLKYLAQDVCLKYFKDDDKKTKFYTGKFLIKLFFFLQILLLNFLFRFIHI